MEVPGIISGLFYYPSSNLLNKLQYNGLSELYKIDSEMLVTVRTLVKIGIVVLIGLIVLLLLNP